MGNEGAGMEKDPVLKMPGMGGMSLLHTHFLHLQIYFGKQTKKDAWHVVKLYECIFSPPPPPFPSSASQQHEDGTACSVK